MAGSKCANVSLVCRLPKLMVGVGRYGFERVPVIFDCGPVSPSLFTTRNPLDLLAGGGASLYQFAWLLAVLMALVLPSMSFGVRVKILPCTLIAKYRKIIFTLTPD